MAFPKLLEKLFQNGGAGQKLNPGIMPYDYARSVNGRFPDEAGDIAVPSRNVGDEWHSFTGQIPVGGVPYCGQIVTRATYADLWDWVQAQGLVKTEEEWQALNTSQNGNVPYYSSGDGSTTFRMPKVVGYIKGAASQSEAGTYTPETAIVLFGVYAFGEITNVGALDADTLATGLAKVEANLSKSVKSVNGAPADADGNVCTCPDYSTGVSVTIVASAGFTAPYDCYAVFKYNRAWDSGRMLKLVVDGFVADSAHGYDNSSSGISAALYVCAFVKKGAVCYPTMTSGSTDTKLAASVTYYKLQ